MDDKLINAILIILTSVIGVSVLSVILSKNANTVGVISAAAGGFSNILGTAMSPITGKSSFNNLSSGSSGSSLLSGGGLGDIGSLLGGGMDVGSLLGDFGGGFSDLLGGFF